MVAVRCAALLLVVARVAAVIRVGASEAVAMIEAQEFSAIIDIRAGSTIAAGHLEGAIALQQADLSGCANTERKFAFYCDTGGAAQYIATRYERENPGQEAYNR